jgi:hypothetical protein
VSITGQNALIIGRNTLVISGLQRHHIAGEIYPVPAAMGAI